MKGKKAFSLGQAPALVISFALFVIITAIGATVLHDIQKTTTGYNGSAGCNNCGADYNASAKGLLGVKNLANWAPTVGTIFGAIIIIGLVGYFAMRSGQ